MPALLDEARRLTLRGHGSRVTYSRNVFIPLTKLCRDVCHYCAFASRPSELDAPYLSPEEVLAIARRGEGAGCSEALFTLGDKPEARYGAARDWLAENGYESTLAYLKDMARLVFEETSLMPHLNPGLLSAEDFRALRPYSVSMGIMLESSADRLSARGGPHFGSPDKLPQRRFATIEAAGRERVPFTTGILIGIGETRQERLDALFKLRAIHERYGHIQEIIVQNFRAKARTRMADAPEPPLDDHLWTIAAARLIFGPSMTIQAPPNLRPRDLAALLNAGVNDWGGVSPATDDHVNPEAPWPQIDLLREATEHAERFLVERLAIAPAFARDVDQWTDAKASTKVRRAADGFGLRRVDAWSAGAGAEPPGRAFGSNHRVSASMQAIIDDARRGEGLSEQQIACLFEADEGDAAALIRAADELREQAAGPIVTYVVNRNINYTNFCLYKCGFCAFSKGAGRAARGPSYLLDEREIASRVSEAVQRGATEVCLQGGIHPDYDGRTYLRILNAVRDASPGVHIHAFSPLEVTHGARTLGLSLRDYLRQLKSAGLATLPGTAAEILDDAVRKVICPDKVTTAEWLEVMETAHELGLRSTATIMFGHVDRYEHWARHLLRIAALQRRTGGFTEFVPLPFVHMEAPIWRKGNARSGPSYREALLMHSIARLALHPVIPNIQTSWVKMGRAGAVEALCAGANDIGGTLMNESITRAAGGVNGQECGPDAMRSIAESAGRPARERTTLYQFRRPRSAGDFLGKTSPMSGLGTAL
ncbi:MAG: 5-amino-6-(D-ribitylamino)uracil--L-tyrosine 4-hydroxyphenyl transferase CofH [Pseudomonadota bacterium]|nr:5-amino-6-(D-ribitylamino)uracil--L-tyrosine 4-hydroxyphenyl transferase CofH [Pseudomonadota bacterium]